MKPLPEVTSEECVHRKKSKTSNKSKADKKSDHKHTYEKCIVRGIFGFCWGEVCSVCGKHKSPDYFSYKDFTKPEYKDKHFINASSQYSFDEIRKMHPNKKIFMTINNNYFYLWI